jgi:hypothetical protein
MEFSVQATLLNAWINHPVPIHMVIQHALEKLGIVVGNTWVFTVFNPVSATHSDESREAKDQSFQRCSGCNPYADNASAHDLCALSIKLSVSKIVTRLV